MGSLMGSVLNWQGLLFYIPLGTGLLLLVGSAAGGAGHDGDADGGHDHAAGGGSGGGHEPGDGHGHSHDHDGDAPPSSLPLLFRVGLAAVIFGGTGAALAQLGLPGAPFLPIALASLTSLTLTRLLGRLGRRFLPSVETYRVSRRDLIGRVGILVLPAGPDTGLVQVKDHEGNLHQVLCHTSGALLPSGDEVLLLEDDATRTVFTVETCPPEARLKSTSTSPFLES